jgi:hypothetical protein
MLAAPSCNFLFSYSVKNVKVRICKTIILSVVLYEYGIWFITSEEEHRLKVFQNRMIRRIFGLKMMR